MLLESRKNYEICNTSIITFALQLKVTASHSKSRKIKNFSPCTGCNFLEQKKKIASYVVLKPLKYLLFNILFYQRLLFVF